MESTMAAVLTAFLFMGSATSALAASPPANDDMTNATTISALPFSATVNLSPATIEPGENVDCVFPSTASVWYRYVVPAKQLIQVDLTGSDPDAGVRIYYEYNGYPPTLGNCVSMQYSGFKLMVGPVTTLWFQLTVDTGSSATLSITSLPLLTMSATLDPTATYDAKAGTITASGTMTCNLVAYGGVFVTLHQRQGRSVAVSQGFAQATCGPTPTRWTATLYGTVNAGSATADWSAQAVINGPPDQSAQVSGGPSTLQIRKR